MRRPAIVVNLEDTVADIGEWRREIVNRMARDHMVLVISNREESFRNETEEWLRKQELKWDNLYLRSLNDSRAPEIVKHEIFDKYLRDEFRILFVIDEGPKAVNMWRDQGLVCLQSAP